MRQIYNTNLIDFAVQHGFEIEKGDRNTVHVKHSGGLYLFKHGRGYVCFSKEGSKGIYGSQRLQKCGRSHPELPCL